MAKEDMVLEWLSELVSPMYHASAARTVAMCERALTLLQEKKVCQGGKRDQIRYTQPQASLQAPIRLRTRDWGRAWCRTHEGTWSRAWGGDCDTPSTSPTCLKRVRAIVVGKRAYVPPC